MLFDLFGPLLGPLLLVILVIVVFESCWRKCPPDKLMIVSGFGQTRSVSGKGTFVIPGLQRVDTLALGAVQVQLSTENEIPTQDAILIHACAVANFQIGQTPELIEIASKNYLNMDKAEMTRQVTEVMLGKMREVIGQMDLKELMRDRESFNHKVFEGSRWNTGRLLFDKTEEVQVDCIVVPLCYTNIYGMAQPNELQTSSHALSAPQRGILDGYESHF